MKTNLFMALAFAFLMLFAACTEEKIIYIEKENDVELLPGEGILTISLSDVTTRAARPIDHFDPDNEVGEGMSSGNNVNRIGFRIYQHGTTNKISGVTVSSWDGSDVSGATDLNEYILRVDNGMLASKTYQLKLSGLTEGRYIIIAYGYNATGDSDTPPYTISDIENEIYLKAIVNEGDKFYEELFAGSGDVRVNQYGNFIDEYTITLDRQVAGMLVYLEKIPVYVGEDRVKSLTVSTFQNISGIYFPALLYDSQEPSKNEYANGVGTGYDIIDLLTFTFDDDKISNTNLQPGDKYTFKEVFLLPDEMDEDVARYLKSNVTCLPNTLFGSCFLLPFANSDSSRDCNDGWGTRNALHIVLKGESGKTLKIINLKEFKADGEEQAYSIKRNHFYSLGTKINAQQDEDDNPLEIDADSGVEYLLLKIDDGWKENHNLINEIEKGE